MYHCNSFNLESFATWRPTPTSSVLQLRMLKTVFMLKINLKVSVDFTKWGCVRSEKRPAESTFKVLRKYYAARFAI